MRPIFLRNILYLLILASSVVIWAACDSTSDITQFPAKPSSKLTDTLKADDNLEVLLTDLTGGFYLANATGEATKGTYGYNRLERRYISGWSVFDGSDNPLNTTCDYCIIHPEHIERHYASGLKEIIEAPFNLPGLLVTLKYRWGKNLIFRPNFDFRELAREKFSDYQTITETGDKEVPFVLGLADSVGGFVALAVSKSYDFLNFDADVRESYTASEKIGRPYNAIVHSVGDISTRTFSTVAFAFGWGENPEEAIANAKKILATRKQWRSEREKWVANVLSPVDVRADNVKFEKSYAWARLSLAGLIYTSNEQQFLLTALPYSPYPDGMFTAMATPGIAEMNRDNIQAFSLVESLIAYQNTDSTSRNFGKFPGKIHADKVEYNQPLVSGMVARSFQAISSEFPNGSDELKSLLVKAFIKDERGTEKFRMRNKLAISGTQDHFLYDSPAAPERPGKTMESTYLYRTMHGMIYGAEDLEEIAPELASERDSLYDRSVSQYSFSGPEKFINTIIERIKLQHYINQTKYNISADLDSSGVYHSQFSMQTKENNDYIPLDSIDEKRPNKPMAPSSTVRFLKPFFSCFFHNTYGNSYQPALRYATSTSLISPVGLRSLAPSEDEFQNQHDYRSELCSYGTTMQGDALVWTAGCLGEMYCQNNFRGDFLQLYESLSDRCLNTGIIGALPEAENAENVAGVDNTVWSPAHSVSNAEFVRMTNQYLLGLSEEEERQFRFKPLIPYDWGNYRIETSVLGGRIWLERYSGDTWQIGQEGIEPDIRIILEISPAYGESALHNVRVYPGERICVTFKKVSSRTWKAEQRIWSARKQSVKLWGLPNK